MAIEQDLGDFAFEHNCCPDYGVIREWCATDCKNNQVCIEQTIVYQDFGGAPQEAPNVDITAQPVPEMSLSLFPNPSAGNFNLRFRTEDKEAIVVIYDMAGRVIQSHQIVHETTDVFLPIDLSSMQSGLYLIQVKTKKQTKTERIMVQPK